MSPFLTTFLNDEADPEFQVAPMVDVLLVLLLFFMATATTEILEQPKDLVLPSSLNSIPIEKRSNYLVLHLVVNNSNSILFAGRSYPDVAGLIPEILKQQAVFKASNPDSNEESHIFIRADKEIPFRRIGEIMQACSKAGIHDVGFGVQAPNQ